MLNCTMSVTDRQRDKQVDRETKAIAYSADKLTSIKSKV